MHLCCVICFKKDKAPLKLCLNYPLRIKRVILFVLFLTQFNSFSVLVCMEITDCFCGHSLQDYFSHALLHNLQNRTNQNFPKHSSFVFNPSS